MQPFPRGMKKYYLIWIYAVTLAALVLSGAVTLYEKRKTLSDSTARTLILIDSIEDSLLANYYSGRYSRISRLEERVRKEHRLLSMSICNLLSGESITFPEIKGGNDPCKNPIAQDAYQRTNNTTRILSDSHRHLQYFFHPMENGIDKNPTLFLILVQDITPLTKNWIESFLRSFVFIWIGGLLLLLLVTAQVRQWLKRYLRMLHRTLRAAVAGKKPQNLPKILDEPISKEIDNLAAKIRTLQPVLRDQSEPPQLQSLRASIGQQNLMVISNREPYIHNQSSTGAIELVRPASGLVTALEPILRQFGGRWIAHGSGSADFDVTNHKFEVAVPPLNPTYTLQRVRLSKEEEFGYYYGFANEGLWPLCHLAHNRPIFRLSDWEFYRSVNKKFSDSIPASELKETSIVLVQDYHFALLPQLLRSRMQATPAKIGLFWHIPWPNPEAFGICPWNEALLKGMLGSDLIGFHTQYHCNNFLETCNRYLEARIDWEHFSVTMDNHVTQVRAFPIGIDTAPVKTLTDKEIHDLKRRYGISTEWVAVGVDRVDYTKGLVERVEGVERFLEKYPQYIGRFTLVQMGSPSRAKIPAYRLLTEQLEEVVQRVNQRFGGKGDSKAYRPVVFLNEHHEWEEIQYFYQIGDLCLVTSLHDGMNLVAKEYVWCQKPERGSLILSKFTGASRELTEAFIVNPYAIEELADAIAAAIALPESEKARRMSAMREKISSRSAFHWASDLIRALMTKEAPSGTQTKESGLVSKLPLVEGF